MKCPFCDFENPPGVTACGFCGAFLPSEEAETTKGDESILDRSAGRQIRCSYCWKINPATNEVCEECGMPLAYGAGTTIRRAPSSAKNAASSS